MLLWNGRHCSFSFLSEWPSCTRLTATDSHCFTLPCKDAWFGREKRTRPLGSVSMTESTWMLSSHSCCSVDCLCVPLVRPGGSFVLSPGDGGLKVTSLWEVEGRVPRHAAINMQQP